MLIFLLYHVRSTILIFTFCLHFPITSFQLFFSLNLFFSPIPYISIIICPAYSSYCLLFVYLIIGVFLLIPLTLRSTNFKIPYFVLLASIIPHLISILSVLSLSCLMLARGMAYSLCPTILSLTSLLFTLAVFTSP